MAAIYYGNIFEALTDSPEEAADMKFRSDLILLLRDKFEAHSLDQTQIGELLGVPQPRVSELMTGKVSKFSADKLIGFAAAAGVRFSPRYVPKTRSKPEKVECDVLCVA